MVSHVVYYAYDCMRLQIGWVGEMGGWEDGGDGGRAGWPYLSLSLILSNYFVSRRVVRISMVLFAFLGTLILIS